MRIFAKPALLALLLLLAGCIFVPRTAQARASNRISPSAATGRRDRSRSRSASRRAWPSDAA